MLLIFAIRVRSGKYDIYFTLKFIYLDIIDLKEYAKKKVYDEI
jgi:hypothetical protein